MPITRESFLARPVKVESFDITDFQPVKIRVLSVAELRAWSKRTKDEKVAFDTSLFALCLGDEDGARLFKDDELDVIAQAIPHIAVKPLFDICVQVNRLEMKEKSVEEKTAEDAEAVKTSGATTANS